MSLKPLIPRRVVVTGLGFVTPVGSNKESFWKNISTGQSGIVKISKIDTSDFPAKIGGEVIDFDINDYMERKEIRHMDPYCQFAMGAGYQAMKDSGLDLEACNPERCGVIVGSGIGGMKVFEDQHTKTINRGPKRISPFFIPMLIADIAAGHLSIAFNFQGPNWAPISACATSAHAVGLAMKTIRWGDADIIIAGGAEAPISDMGLGGFCAMKALSIRNDEPSSASRPFDKDRDGFVMSEGSCILILEEKEHAMNRGAKIYGEIAGAGFTGDAFHITAPIENGRGAIKAMEIAMEDAGIDKNQVDYINAHGTSTPLNDMCETHTIKQVFGEKAYDLAISSTKSMHGHMLGATGAVEIGATLLSIQNDLIPPTINYHNPDPDCDLNYTPNQAAKKRISIALSNSFGFGGHNVSVAVRRFEE